jgi:plastocyanin
MGPPPSASKALGKYSADANAFFPRTTTIRVGDSVRFVPFGFHTVDLPNKGGKPIAVFAPQGTVSGAVDPTGAPFWFNGQPSFQFNLPTLAPKGFGKKFTYSGAKRVESGLPVIPKPKPVTVKFTKPGTYTYYCDVHPGMKARVQVRARFSRIPSAKAHAKRIKDQVRAAIATAKKLSKQAPTGNTVSLDLAGRGGVEILAMVPSQKTVAVGTTVTFQMPVGSVETHTATFGPGNIEDPSTFIGKIAKSFEGPAIDNTGIYPSEPPGTTGTLTPTLHGIGFWNSGALDRVSASPLPPANQVTLGAPGTYTFYCLIHPFMKGTVTVQ